MTDSEKNKLEGFLAKALNIATEDLASLYNDAGELSDLSIAEKADTARIKKLKDDAASQYKRGLKEGASKLETELKDKYEIESDLIGVELFAHVLEAEVGKVTQNDKDITSHPEYLKLRTENEKALKARDKEWQKKLDEAENSFKKQAVSSKVKDRALAALDGMKPILPEDSKKASRWREMFVNEVLKYEYQEQDNNFVPLKDGKAREDGHANIIGFDDHIREIAGEFFDFETAERRSSSGNRQTTDTPPEKPIKDKEEYIRLSAEAKTPEERIKIAERFGVLTKK